MELQNIKDEFEGIRVNKTKFKDSFSEEIFNQTYRFGLEKDVNERHSKIAENLAQVENSSTQKKWKNNFMDLLEDFKFVPGEELPPMLGLILKVQRT